MQTARSVTAEIKSRGQLTIPKKIRVMSRLEEGQVVSIIPVGDSVIITPKRLELDDARREIKRILKATGISPEGLLAGLKEKEGIKVGSPYASRLTCLPCLPAPVPTAHYF